MQEMFEHFTGENSEVYNLLTQKEINQIRVKLGKKHIKESDWIFIREILSAHNVIVLEPVVSDAKLSVKEHVLYDNGIMVAFTNIEKCREYVNIINRRDAAPNRLFQLGIMPFDILTEIARKYGIEERLPILIAEKTGPHFAVGDTCYSYEEDNVTYNPDGKAIVARENEISCKRTTNPQEAYFSCHTDITIPYDELGSIRAVKNDGSSVSIIENGRFVLAGTEELNKPLDGDC